jgi:DNA invertase Pin-like site-specific DNA recombinase
MAVYGYIRVSTDEQVNGTSLDEQRRQITGLAMTVGLALDNILSDPAISGSVALFERPGGRRLAALAPGDVVIAAKLDRRFAPPWMPYAPSKCGSGPGCGWSSTVTAR